MLLRHQWWNINDYDWPRVDVYIHVITKFCWCPTASFANSCLVAKYKAIILKIDQTYICLINQQLIGKYDATRKIQYSSRMLMLLG